MKKLWTVVVVAFMAILLCAGAALAKAPVAKKAANFPYLVGKDVHYPAADLEQNTPGWQPGMKFYLALHESKWDPKEGSKFEMKKVGNEYIARNVFNKRHHPVLPGQVWFKIEDAYPEQLPDEGQYANNIDRTNPKGPCFLFGNENAKTFKDGGK